MKYIAHAIASIVLLAACQTTPEWLTAEKDAELNSTLSKSYEAADGQDMSNAPAPEEVGRSEKDAMMFFKGQKGRISLSEKEMEIIKKLYDNFVLDIMPRYNRAEVSTEFWLKLDKEQKKAISFYMAVFCGNFKGNYLYWVDMYDKVLEKKVAYFSESWNEFVVYDIY